METNLVTIAANAADKEEENNHFISFLKKRDNAALDEVAHGLNNKVSNDIDCTACGNCCRSLVINVT